MTAGVKILQNKGFVLKEDSQFFIFERRELDTRLFDQIRIKKDTKTVKFLSYILTKEDGYREEALSVDDTMMAAVLVFLSDIKKKEKKNGDKGEVVKN